MQAAHMYWTNVSRFPDKYAYLRQTNGEFTPATEYLLTVSFSGRERADAYRHPFLIGRGESAELAEQAAYLIYLRAQDCDHDFQPDNLVTQSCRHCGVMLRMRPGAPVSARARPRWLAWWRPQRRTAS